MSARMMLVEDDSFLDYRLSVINEGDTAGAVQAMVDGGALGGADLVLLDLPAADNAWGWQLIANPGRVYGVDGRLIEPRPAPPA